MLSTCFCSRRYGSFNGFFGNRSIKKSCNIMYLEVMENTIVCTLMLFSCRTIDLSGIGVSGEKFPVVRNRGRRICTSSYLVGLAFRPQRELFVLLTLYLEHQ